MRYKISFFLQSHSQLFLRNVSPTISGLFDCLIFVGVARLSLADVFDFEEMLVTECQDGIHKKYDFGGEPANTVQAVAVYYAKVRDFPEVPRVEVSGEPTLLDVVRWPAASAAQR